MKSIYALVSEAVVDIDKKKSGKSVHPPGVNLLFLF
jgi:hypothetical protein